jgi:hypothetical protein
VTIDDFEPNIRDRLLNHDYVDGYSTHMYVFKVNKRWTGFVEVCSIYLVLYPVALQ